jgi:hypothetical protein
VATSRRSRSSDHAYNAAAFCTGPGGQFRTGTVYDAWTQAPDVQEAFRNELSHASPAPLTLPMVLVNDGWTISTAPAAMQ